MTSHQETAGTPGPDWDQGGSVQAALPLRGADHLGGLQTAARPCSNHHSEELAGTQTHGLQESLLLGLCWREGMARPAPKSLGTQGNSLKVLEGLMDLPHSRSLLLPGRER